MNMFIRSHPAFKVEEADKALAVLRKAKVVGSDETGARIEGTNSYDWVFHCKDAVVHWPDYTRAGRVVDEVLGGHVPEVWIATPNWPSSTAPTICPGGSSYGSTGRSRWRAISGTSRRPPARVRSASWKSGSRTC
jgi:hypothetical protein